MQSEIGAAEFFEQLSQRRSTAGVAN